MIVTPTHTSLLRTLLSIVFLALGLYSSVYAQEKQSRTEINAQVEESYKKFRKGIVNKDFGYSLNQIDNLLTYLKEQKQDVEWVKAMTSKAELFRSVHAIEAAVDVISDAEPVAIKIKNSKVKSRFYNRKAAILFEAKEAKAALVAVETSQRIDSTENLTWQKLSNYNIQGAAYRDLKMHKKAQDVLKKSAFFAWSQSDTVTYCRILSNLCLSFFRNQEYDSTIVYGKKIIALRNAIENDALIDDNYRIIAHSYYYSSQYDSAYRYLDSAHINSLERMQDIVDSRVGLFKFQKELEEERLQNSVLVAEQKSSDLKIILLLIGLVSIAVIAILGFRQRANFKRLSEERKQLNTELSATLDFKNKMIRILAHDIRNPMSSITSLVNLYRTEELDANEIKPFMLSLENSAVQVNILLENLLNWMISQKGDLSPNMEALKLYDIFNNALKEVEAQYVSKQIHVVAEPVSINLVSDQNFLSLIIRNLLTNAIKFSNVGGKIELKAEETNTTIQIKIVDNGIGMSQDKVKELTDTTNSISNNGTSLEKGTGIGLQLVRELVAQLNGKLLFESEENVGTTAIVELQKK